MEPVTRVCLETQEIADGEKRLVLIQGHKYLTSPVDEDGNVTVFTRYWLKAPCRWFAAKGPELSLRDRVEQLAKDLLHEAHDLRERAIDDVTDPRGIAASEREYLVRRLLEVCA